MSSFNIKEQQQKSLIELKMDELAHLKEQNREAVSQSEILATEIELLKKEIELFHMKESERGNELYERAYEVEKFRQSLRETNTKTDFMDQEINLLRSEVDYWKKKTEESNEKTKELSKFKEKFNNLTNEKEKITKEFEDACLKMVLYERSILELKEKNEVIKQIQLETEEILREKDELFGHLEELEDENKRLKNTMNDSEILKKTIEVLQEENLLLKTEISHNELQIRNADNENYQFTVQKQAKDADIEALKITIESLRDANEQQITTLRHYLNTTTQIQTFVNQENSELKLNFEKMDEEVNELSYQNEKMMRENSSLNKEIDNLRTKLLKVETEHEKFMRINDERSEKFENL